MNILELLVPSWVNWVAVDKSGSVWAYENKPVLKKSLDRWEVDYKKEGDAKILFRVQESLLKEGKYKGWKKSLQEITHE